MKRLLGGLLILLLTVVCVSAAPSRPTLRTPEMSNFEFLALAEKQVREKFPEWYVKDTNTILYFESPPWSDSYFASVSKGSEGPPLMFIFQLSWDLTTVEDLALVLLHEYVHVKLWDRLEAEIPEDDCRNAVSELAAYSVERSQDKLAVSVRMNELAEFERLLYSAQLSMFCPDGTDIADYLNLEE